MLAVGVFWFVSAGAARGAEKLPASPPRYFNDDAGVVSPKVADDLNAKLEQFERQTSNQIVVAIYPRMQSDDALAAYTTRIYQSWKVGQKAKSNGAVLFVFVQDRKMQIVTGYGLEGALPDAICKRIIDDEIAPRFKAGDYDAGVTAGVNAMIAATKGEYKGTGRTARERQGGGAGGWRIDWFWVIVVLLILYGVVKQLARNRAGRLYGSHRPSGCLPALFYWWAMSQSRRTSGWGGGGWSSGGGSWGGGGGGFSGGGGSTGGGGAGGSW
jgi:uncharacterized protein